MTALVLQQTLHGYDQGHQLLCWSGDLDDRERSTLDKLSDLSGYLPSGTTFDRYLTGFPCGRYYAIASTWPDTNAQRRGTVLTHTLLLPKGQIGEVQSLDQLTSAHRRPSSASNLAPYRTPIAISEGESDARAKCTRRLAIDERKAAIALLFGQSTRPILWETTSPPDEVVHFLWTQLWPDARYAFAFCTLAVQVRHVDGRPFDFLGLPPAARGSFHDRANSPAWWQDGRLSDSGMRQLGEEPWVGDIAGNPAVSINKLREWLLRHELPMPSVFEFRAALRLVELETAGAQRLTAARARADLIARLYPDLDPHHPLYFSALSDLSHRLHEAPVSPRPLWEVADYLARSPVRQLLETDRAWAEPVFGIVAQQVKERLLAAPRLAAEGIADILSNQHPGEIADLLRRSVSEAIASGNAGDDTAMAAVVLSAAATKKNRSLALAALSAIGPEQRERAFQIAHGDSSKPAELRSLVLAAALELRDPLLTFAAVSLDGDPVAGLLTASHVIASDRAAGPERMIPILKQSSTKARLEWALGVTESSWASWAAVQGAAAARELGISLSQLADRCESAPNGVRVFASAASGAQDATESLRIHRTLARAALELCLSHGASYASDAILEPALNALQPDDLIGAWMFNALTALNHGWRLRATLDRLVPSLLGAMSTGATAIHPPLAEWLRQTHIQEWVQDADIVRLRECIVDERRRSWLRNVVLALESTIDNDKEPRSCAEHLLQVLLPRADRYVLEESLQALVLVNRRLMGVNAGKLVRAETLGAVRNSPPPEGYRLVEVTFPFVYGDLTNGRAAAYEAASWWDEMWWDRAVNWSRWLLNVWLNERWPADSFLHCIAGNVNLLEVVADIASGSRAGREFFRQLPAAGANLPASAALRRELSSILSGRKFR